MLLSYHYVLSEDSVVLLFLFSLVKCICGNPTPFCVGFHLGFEAMAAAQANDVELHDMRSSRTASLFSCSRSMWCDVATGTPRLFIPEVLRRQVFDALHNLAHPDVRASEKMIFFRYVRPCVNKDVGADSKHHRSDSHAEPSGSLDLILRGSNHDTNGSGHAIRIHPVQWDHRIAMHSAASNYKLAKWSSDCTTLSRRLSWHSGILITWFAIFSSAP